MPFIELTSLFYKETDKSDKTTINTDKVLSFKWQSIGNWRDRDRYGNFNEHKDGTLITYDDGETYTAVVETPAKIRQIIKDELAKN